VTARAYRDAAEIRDIVRERSDTIAGGRGFYLNDFWEPSGD
jgi:hypothetical protein